MSWPIANTRFDVHVGLPLFLGTFRMHESAISENESAEFEFGMGQLAIEPTIFQKR